MRGQLGLLAKLGQWAPLVQAPLAPLGSKVQLDLLEQRGFLAIPGRLGLQGQQD